MTRCTLCDSYPASLWPGSDVPLCWSCATIYLGDGTETQEPEIVEHGYT